MLIYQRKCRQLIATTIFKVLKLVHACQWRKSQIETETETENLPRSPIETETETENSRWRPIETETETENIN